MPELRQLRGMALPRFGHVVALFTVLGAGWVLWTEAREHLRDGGSRLKRESPGDRRRMIDALVERGPAATDELVALLSNSNPRTRFDALLGLERLGPDAGKAAAAVRQRLSDSSPRVREYALVALSRICENQDEVIAAAAERLVDASSEVAETATRRLESMGSRVIPVVIEAAGHEVPEARRRAVRILKDADRRRDPQEVTGVLRRLLHDSSPEVRREAIAAVVARGAATIADVREWLHDENPAIVEQGLRAVPALEAQAVEVLPELDRLLHHDDPLPPFLLNAVASLRTAARPLVPGVLQRAETPSERDRLQAATTLIEIGADSPQVLRLLISLVDDGPLNIRHDAAVILARVDVDEARRRAARLIADIETGERAPDVSTLGLLHGLGSAAEAAVPLMIRLIRDGDPAVQSAAVNVLGTIGPSAAPAVPDLIGLLGRRVGYSHLELSILSALGGIGPAARPAVPKLLAILTPTGNPMGHAGTARSNGYGVEIDAIRALGRIDDGSPQVLAVLRRLLTIDNVPYYPTELSQYRVSAIQSLVLLDPRSKGTLSVLLHALDDRAWEVRSQAALATGHVAGDPRQSIEPLAAALDDDEWIVQTAAALALGEFGPEVKPAVPALLRMSRDHRNRVPNELRSGARIPDLQFIPDGGNLGRWSVAAAARSALAAIAPGRADASDHVETPVKKVSRSTGN